MVDFLFYFQFSVISCSCIYACIYMVECMNHCEILNKFQLFLFYERVQGVHSVARSALTESVSTRKLRRDSMNLCMQGVHRHLQGVCDRVFRLESSGGVV
jgi:hypothetical protein